MVIERPLNPERTKDPVIDRNFDNAFAWINAANLNQYIKRDGTRELSGNWDAGNWEIRARTFKSDVATGTPPMVVASTTLVNNLNADLLDGKEESAFFLVDGSRAMSGNVQMGGNDIGDLGNVTFKTGAVGGTLRTGTAAADKFVLQAYDVDGEAYVTLIEANAGNDPTLQMFDDLMYIEDRTDPTKRMRFQTSGVATGTTRVLTVPDANGTIALGTGGASRMAYWSSANAITSDANFTWNGTTLEISEVNGPIIKVAQKTTVAGGTLLWLTAAGVDSASNSGGVRFHTGGAIWGQTGGNGLYIGTYDKTTTHLRISNTSTFYFNGNLEIGASSISNGGTGGITISAAGTVSVSGTFNAAGVINANAASLSVDADGTVKMKHLQFKNFLSVGVGSDQNLSLATYFNSIIKFYPTSSGYTVTIQNPEDGGVYFFSNTHATNTVTLDFGDFTYLLPNHGRYYGLIAWYDGTQWNRTGDAY